MLIKSIVIEGVEEDITITRTELGAVVTVERFTRRSAKHDRVVASITRDEDRESQYAKAREAAGFIYGRDGRGRPNGTNSMIHDVLDAIDRVAGC